MHDSENAMMLQNTVAGPIELQGTGLHSGEPTKVYIEPASASSGINFRSIYEDTEECVRAHYSNLVSANNAITIGTETFSIQTIEHFMAAFYAFSITNANVIVYGNEMPILG